MKGVFLMKTKSLVNAAIMLAIYMVFFVLYYIGIFPTIMSILLPIPLIAYSVTGNKVHEVGWLLIGCFIGTFLFGSVYGLVTTLNYGVMGALIGIGMIKKWPYWQRLLNAALVFVFSFPITTYVLTGLNFQESIAQMADEMNSVFELMSPLVSGNNTEVLTTLQATMTTMMTTLLPTILILVGLASAYLSDTVATFVLRRMKVRDIKRANIQDFQLGATLAVILLLSQLALIFVHHHAINVILVNIIMFLNLLFLVQGIIVMLSFFKARNQKGIGVLVVVFALISSLSMIISMLGIMDALFDYRERFVIKKS